MNNMIRSLINILPTKLQLILSKLYFARLLKKQRLLSSEVEHEMLGSWIKQGDNCLDIGANIGRYTFKMSKIVGQKGHVFSFEPMHYQFHILTHLCSSSNYNNIS